MKSRRGAAILATMLLMAILTTAAAAQAPTDSTKSGGTITQTSPDSAAMLHAAPATPPPMPPPAANVQATAPPPQQQAMPPIDPGMFGKGQRHVSGVIGYAHSFDTDYLLVGVGASYFIRNGMQVGLDFEGWFLGDPTIYKVSPRIDYVAWRMQRIKPYAGAFYRWNFIGGGLDDHSSLGGRAGAFYKGDRGGMAGAGFVYERYLGIDDRFSSDVFYPEFFVAKSF